MSELTRLIKRGTFGLRYGAEETENYQYNKNDSPEIRLLKNNYRDSIENLKEERKRTFDALAELGAAELNSFRTLGKFNFDKLTDIKNAPELGELPASLCRDIFKLDDYYDLYPTYPNANEVIPALYGAIPTLKDFHNKSVKELGICYDSNDDDISDVFDENEEDLEEFAITYYLNMLNIKFDNNTDDFGYELEPDEQFVERLNEVDILCGKYINEFLGCDFENCTDGSRDRIDKANTAISEATYFLRDLRSSVSEFMRLLQMVNSQCLNSIEATYEIFSKRGDMDWNLDFTLREQNTVKSIESMCEILYKLCSTPIIKNLENKNIINTEEISTLKSEAMNILA